MADTDNGLGATADPGAAATLDSPAPVASARPADPQPEPRPARRKAASPAPRKRAAGAPGANPPEQAASQPAPQQSAKPLAAAAPLNSLSETMMAQTAESLGELSVNLTEAMTRANQVYSLAFLDQAKDAAQYEPDPFKVQDALGSVWSHLATQPETLRDAHAQLWRAYASIWERHTAYMMTGQAAPADGPRDKRFTDPEWRSNPAFSMLRETYLATSDFITGLIDKAEGVDEQAKRKAAFFVKQAVDAASPSNFLMTNPAALRAVLETKGESLKKGLENFAHDMKRGHGNLAISQTDISAFQVGVNVATAPGKVVFRNDIFELIQYAPSTETVRKAPLLIFPPWINKFYIMDLQPKNSLIRWLVAQGNTVFLVSWVNPDEDMSERGFEDYMQGAIFAAVDAVQEATGEDKINTVGYCVGGTLLAASLAYMAKTGDARIQSATFFASQSDFTYAGDLLVFADDAGINYLEDRIDQHGGFLDAQAMADTFNSLRANDLVWSYVVDNYYLGKQPTSFDLLYWNADQTRMPKALHLYYLRNFYRDNLLSQNKLTVLGEKLSLQDVKIPIFMQSSKEDHIAPCKSVHKSATRFGGPVEFIVAGSGHIAGVINHPSANKYQYWTNPNLAEALDDWMAFAEEHPGSWWPHWDTWMARLSGPQVPARTPGDGSLKPLCDAPGEYVLVRSED